jgi:hypothetical protein
LKSRQAHHRCFLERQKKPHRPFQSQNRQQRWAVQPVAFSAHSFAVFGNFRSKSTRSFFCKIMTSCTTCGCGPSTSSKAIFIFALQRTGTRRAIQIQRFGQIQSTINKKLYSSGLRLNSFVGTISDACVCLGTCGAQSSCLSSGFTSPNPGVAARSCCGKETTAAD